MKKSIIFAALAAAAVAMPSCSSDQDEVLNNGEGIRFTVSAGKQSRAIAVDNNSIKQFHVWAVASNNTTGFFMNCDVTKDDGTGNWNYNPTKFWPQSNPVNFFAISAGTVAGYTNITSSVTANYTGGVGGMELKDYTVVENADLDVLYAAYYGASKKDGTVKLNFRHAISQLAFAAKCTNTDLTIYVKSIRVDNIKNKGTLAGPIATTKDWLEHDNSTTTETGDNWGVWSGQDGKATYKAPFHAVDSEPLTATATEYSVDGGKYDGLLVLPQEITPWNYTSHGADLNGSRFLIKCQILSGTEKTQIWPKTNGEYAEVAIPVPAHTWQQGMRYVYTFDFNEGAGYTPDPVAPGTTPEPVLSKVKISVTVDEFQNGGTYGVDMGTAE